MCYDLILRKSYVCSNELNDAAVRGVSIGKQLLNGN
jgi:hypothetical protein